MNKTYHKAIKPTKKKLSNKIETILAIVSRFFAQLYWKNSTKQNHIYECACLLHFIPFDNIFTKN